jgi:hypothetical protein
MARRFPEEGDRAQTTVRAIVEIARDRTEHRCSAK